MTDYSDLLTNVRNYTETSSDVLSDAVINTFIVNVENKLFKEVDLSYYRKYDTASLTQDIAFLSLPGDWRATRFLQIVVSDVRTTLLQKDISFMTEYWPVFSNRASNPRSKIGGIAWLIFSIFSSSTSTQTTW